MKNSSKYQYMCSTLDELQELKPEAVENIWYPSQEELQKLAINILHDDPHIQFWKLYSVIDEFVYDCVECENNEESEKIETMEELWLRAIAYHRWMKEWLNNKWDTTINKYSKKSENFYLETQVA